MTAEESSALVELLAEKLQSRIDDIRTELYLSVDQALAQVLRLFFFGPTPPTSPGPKPATDTPGASPSTASAEPSTTTSAVGEAEGPCSRKQGHRRGTCSVQELCRALEEAGFEFRAGGRHAIHYVHPSGGRPIVIPAHRRDLKNGTLSTILRQVRQTAGVTLAI